LKNGKSTPLKHVDATRFALQAGGSPALMSRIALAFVGQLPEWRKKLVAAAQQPDQLASLLHKMKGSCHAISATVAAETFAKAELALC
jgi:HPt (histidine-containing phosphotransfer) domain-containing protein